MRIVITTLIWKRPKLVNVWCKAIQRIINSFPEVDIVVLVAGSEGDKSRNLIESHGFDYIETPNQPLSNKANRRLIACKNYKSDYVLFLGSDDFINNKTFDFILDKMKIGHDEIAPMDLYYYDTVSKSFVYCEGYTNHRKGEQLAIARSVTRDVLNKIGWQMFDPNKTKGLDSGSKKRLKSAVQNPYYYSIKENDLFILDVKTETNITKFQRRSNQHNVSIEKLSYLEEHHLIKSL